MEAKKNIIITDHQFLIVEAVKAVLNNSNNYNVTVSATNKTYFERYFDENHPDLLIVDHTAFDFLSIEYLGKLHATHNNMSILILTNSISKNEINEFLKFGIKNIVLKTIGIDELLMAVEFTLIGKKYYSDELLDLLLYQKESNQLKEENKNLTSSELDIIKLIADGLTTKEIASQKNLSFHTINTHRKNIFRKLGVNNTSELIIHAIKSGWIDNIEYYI